MSDIQILVVEDEHVVAQDLATRLQHLGYDVPARVDTGEAAVRQTGAIRPDLVDMSQAVDNPLSDTDLLPPGTFWSTWDRQNTDNGIYGKPSVASAESGKIFFEAAVREAIQCLEVYHGRGH